MSLSDLPIELIVEIFTSVDSISSAAALSQTSRRIYKIWRCNLTSICDAVLPRMIESYDQAHQFLKVKEISNIPTTQSSIDDKANAAVLREKALLINADTVRLNLKTFEDEDGVWGQCAQCAFAKDNIDQQKERPLDDSSRTRFLQGYYRAKSIIYLLENEMPELKQTLASMHLLEFFRAYQVIVWLLKNTGPWGRLGGNFVGCRFFDRVVMDLEELPGMQPLIDELRKGNHECHLLTHNGCIREKAERARGVALADLLPLLPRSGLVGTYYEFLLQQ